MKQLCFLIVLTLCFKLIFNDMLTGQSSICLSNQTASLIDQNHSFKNDAFFPFQLGSADTIPPESTPPNPQTEAPFTVIEELPYVPDLPDCKEVIDSVAKVDCFDEVLMKHIYQHLEYPKLARDHKVEGTVVIRMNMDKDTKTYCAKILRDIGAQTGAAALKAVNLSLQELLKDFEPCKWRPSKPRGNPVRTSWNIPVKFRL